MHHSLCHSPHLPSSVLLPGLLRTPLLLAGSPFLSALLSRLYPHSSGCIPIITSLPLSPSSLTISKLLSCGSHLSCFFLSLPSPLPSVLYFFSLWSKVESLSGPQWPSGACSKLPSTHTFYCSLVVPPPKIMRSRFIIFLTPQKRYDATTFARINIGNVYFCTAQLC